MTAGMGFSFDLTGRRALVTGASSGLGTRFGRILAASGAEVALGARRKDRLEALAHQIGPNAAAVQMDVSARGRYHSPGFDAAEAGFRPPRRYRDRQCRRGRRGGWRPPSRKTSNSG